MTSRTWEFVAANKIQAGDILAWHVRPDSDSANDFMGRVTVIEVLERPGTEVLPYIVLRVAGPTVAHEPMSGVTTSRTYRQGDAVTRMKPDHAAQVGANLHTVVRLASSPSDVVTNLSDLTSAMRSGLAHWNTATTGTRRALIRRGFVQDWRGELTPAGERALTAMMASGDL